MSFILINFFLNLILVRFKGIEANYLFVYQTHFNLKISHMIFLKIFHSDIKPRDTKRQSDNPKKIK
jgi:hypothetical protein